jgi:diadenosine tetraphosphate (Ap4A) HIT family hydrolase
MATAFGAHVGYIDIGGAVAQSQEPGIPGQILTETLPACGGVISFYEHPQLAAMILSPPPRPEPWSLHPQLARDTIPIGDLALSRVLVVNDANWPWLLLVPRRPQVSEILDLDEVEQAQLMTEITRTARALKAVTACDKLNIAALGNVVPQLHVHIIARRAGDAGWPKPIWGAATPLSHDRGELDRFSAALRRTIWIAPEND